MKRESKRQLIAGLKKPFKPAHNCYYGPSVDVIEGQSIDQRHVPWLVGAHTRCIMLSGWWSVFCFFPLREKIARSVNLDSPRPVGSTSSGRQWSTHWRQPGRSHKFFEPRRLWTTGFCIWAHATTRYEIHHVFMFSIWYKWISEVVPISSPFSRDGWHKSFYYVRYAIIDPPVRQGSSINLQNSKDNYGGFWRVSTGTFKVGSHHITIQCWRCMRTAAKLSDWKHIRTSSY